MRTWANHCSAIAPPAREVDRFIPLWTAPAVVFAGTILSHCGTINHICEHSSLLYSCCLYVDQKLIISAYQA
jgi:hypothetical protein